MCRTNVRFINLAGIVRTEDIERYGINAILAPFVQDLQRLAFEIETEKGEVIRENLFAVCADNKGQHQVVGFKEGFTAAHPCIHCSADLNQVQTMVTEGQVQEIEEAVGNEKKRLSKEYGINHDTVLNQVENFSPVISIPPDLMYNNSEGFMPRTTQFYVNKICIGKKKISLHNLNEKVQNFDYEYSELVDKPSVIKLQQLTGNFHQSPAQTWLLAVTLPTILRDSVDDDCEYSDNYSKMLQVSSIIMGHSASRGMLDFLTLCIAEYLSDFKRVYSVDTNDNIGNVAMEIATLTPKQHSLVNASRHLNYFGSLVQFWCMRMEAKHSEFKDKADCVHNAKNLPFTLWNWYQMRQAWQMLHPLTKDIVTGPRKTVLTETLQFRHLLPEYPTLITVPWMRYNGTKYVARKCYIPIGFNQQECLPLFAELFGIIIENYSPKFIWRSVRTAEHNVQLMAYKVITDGNNFIKYDLEDLVAPNVYHSHISKEEIYLVVKQNFDDLH